MYLHIGNGKSVKKSSIMGIFDLDTATVSQNTKKFIKQREKDGNIEYTDSDLPRSFIVLSDGKIILSRISSSGLKIRGDAGFDNCEE